MHIEDLDFPYPERLVATERADSSRVWFTRVEGDPPLVAESIELPGGLTELLELFEAGDLLVVNDTKVLARRVFTDSGLEILFLESSNRTEWSVLCPATRWKDGVKQTLPGGIELELLARGRPQIVRASKPLTEDYFEQNGDLPLPPYIQKARDERRNRESDRSSYQTAWADRPGSLAAPTASFHFSHQDLEALLARGVQVERVTLHVGLGTFLPVTAERLDDHVMHAEFAEIPERTWQAVLEAKARGHHVWALGTTVTRTLESAAAGILSRADADVVCEHVLSDDRGSRPAYFGDTKLFIRPGFEFKVIDRLLTNFHQPRSTLVALVAAFAGLENVKRVYAQAIEKNFRLFSYGDLSAWIKT